MWGDRMWHFAISVFLIELYGHNLLLTAVVGLVVAGSVLVFGALVGDWVDRNPRIKVAHGSLFIQNGSVILCSIILILVFSYKKWIEQTWDGWLTVVCYMVVIGLADAANLASTALTIAIQRDWIIVITGCNRSGLADLNAVMRRIDQVVNILAAMTVGQIMTSASNVVGCVFILGWTLVSLLVEFICLSRVYRMVPALAFKAGPERYEEQISYSERTKETISTKDAQQFSKHGCNSRSEITPISSDSDYNARLSAQQNFLGFYTALRRIQRMLYISKIGWKAYYQQSVYLAGMSLAFLYTTVLGFDCITTGYAYTQGISGSLLSLLMGVSTIVGLMGTILFTLLRKCCGLVSTGVISSCLHLGCLLLCVFSVFAPGSPLDVSTTPTSSHTNVSLENRTVPDTEMNQLHSYLPSTNMNQPLLSDRSSIHWTNNTLLYDSLPAGNYPDSYVSISLLFSGVISARIGLWAFDLTVTQLLQENIPEPQRGIVNGVQSSMNYLMDLLHFIMVMAAPNPQHFGLLVIISVTFVMAGHTMYFIYTKRSNGQVALERDRKAKRTTSKVENAEFPQTSQDAYNTGVWLT
ncbi:ferroportin-like [Heptranchias perlo]|uniref:ferroportin-like n=1 Tax=Heptranchias perlo TaxID=212740 RepID=UPI00355A5E2A